MQLNFNHLGIQWSLALFPFLSNIGTFWGRLACIFEFVFVCLVALAKAACQDSLPCPSKAASVSPVLDLVWG